MLDRKFLDALRSIVHHLDRTGINWVVTGSCGFALQGITTPVHDIDLQTDRAGAYAIERIFADRQRRPVVYSTAEPIRSHFGALEINGIQVEIMGDIQKQQSDGTWDSPIDLNRYKRWVTVDKMRVPVLDLAYEYEAYRLLGRDDKADLLRRWLDREGR